VIIPPSDTDGDGVDDTVDECPNTPASITVDSVGCVGDEPIMDADGDGITDAMDTCPNTPAGTTVDFIGCAINDATNGTNNTDNTDNTGSAGSGDPTISTTMIMAIIAGLILASISIAALTLFRRGQRDDMDYEEDVMFDSPERPPPSIRGEMRDGYEVIEYPQGTGAWWWRDADTGHWKEWT
jgi:hypothetical protein